MADKASKTDKVTRYRRSEKEKAQDNLDLAQRKLERVLTRKEKVRRQLSDIEAEERELTASADFWSSHPLLQEDEATGRAVKDSPQA